MKISYYNIGCKVNFAEISQIQEQFESLGHDTVKFGEKCDAVVINTCTVTHNADVDCRKIIRRAKKSNPSAFIGVIGCYAQIKPHEILGIEGVNAVVGTKQKFLLPQIIENFTKSGKSGIFVDDIDDLPYHGAWSADNESHTRVVLKMQDGCDYVCTYCTIPLARGHSRSLPFSGLKDTLLKIAGSNFYEVILSGINLGEYKTSTGENFADAIRLIESMNLLQRFRISSIEPNLLTDEIIKIVKNSKNICPHFHIPLQSGSPDILQSMKRRYKAGDFEKLVLKIKEEMPDCCIGIDVITGFPGETDSHFKETYSLLESLPITYLHAFTYSERDFTPAGQFSGKVSSLDKKNRTNELRLLSDIKKAEFYQSQKGKIKSIIPEAFNKTNDSFGGWTENYVRVQVNSSHEHWEELVKEGSKPIMVKLIDVFPDFVTAGLVHL